MASHIGACAGRGLCGTPTLERPRRHKFIRTCPAETRSSRITLAMDGSSSDAPLCAGCENRNHGCGVVLSAASAIVVQCAACRLRDRGRNVSVQGISAVSFSLRSERAQSNAHAARRRRNVYSCAPLCYNHGFDAYRCAVASRGFGERCRRNARTRLRRNVRTWLQCVEAGEVRRRTLERFSNAAPDRRGHETVGQLVRAQVPGPTVTL